MDNSLGAPSGPLAFDGGTLEVAGNLTSLRDVTLNNKGGTFFISPETVATLSGTVGGRGALTVSGAGSLVLTGRNTFTGRTTIRPNNVLTGTVITDNQGQSTGSLPAAGFFKDDGVLTFSQGTNGTFSGTINGNGILNVNGTLTFSPNSSISSSIQINNNGNITGSANNLPSTVNLTKIATLTFNQLSAGIYKGEISGTGSLIKSGPGTLVMTGESSFAGSTTIQTGRLGLEGSLLNSAVTVEREATIFGTGQMKDLTVLGDLFLGIQPPNVSSSVILSAHSASSAPPQVMSHITVTDTVTLKPTALVNAKVTANNRSSELVAKRIFLDGTFDLTSMGPRYLVKDKLFTILAANGKIQGRFANLISSDRLKYNVIYSNNAVKVFVLPMQDFADAFPPGDNSNPARTARYFDTFADTTQRGTDLRHVVLLLDGLLLTGHTKAVDNAFNQIQPAQYGELGGISFLHNELVNKTVSTQQQYLRESRWIDTELRNREGVFSTFSPKQLTEFRKLVDDKLLSGFNTFEQVSKNQIGPRANFLALGGKTKAMRPGNQRIRVGKSSLWVQSYGQIEKSKSNHGD
jgi:autotransporter-associated beta strand protein